MEKKKRILIIILVILILVIVSFSLFIIIKKNNNNIMESYSLDKEVITDIAGNVTTIVNHNCYLVTSNDSIKICYREDNKCYTSNYKGNSIVLEDNGNYLFGEFTKRVDNDYFILKKELNDGTSIEYYFMKKHG